MQYLWVNASIHPIIAVTAVASVSRSSHLKRAGKHAFAHVRRHLVCVAPASFTSHFFIACLRSPLCRRLHANVGSAGLMFLASLALRLRRVSSSLERRSPVSAGRRGSPLFQHLLRSLYGFTHSLACASLERTINLARHHVHSRSHIPV